MALPFSSRKTGVALRLTVVLGLIAIVSLLGIWRLRGLRAGNETLHPLTSAPRFDPQLATRLVPADGQGEVGGLDEGVPFSFELESGDTLAGVLGGFGLEAREAHDVSLALAEHLDLRRLKAGSPFSAYLDPAQTLQAFAMTVDDRGSVTARRNGMEWDISWRDFVRTVQLGVAGGTLDGALESAVRQAGAPVAVTFRMAEALQWDLDFNRDLRQGDSFQVIYEDIYLDGQRRGVGDVLAVHYENRGQVIEAYRFGSDGGLYDEEGRPLKKMFLRSPLPYSRVTSGFSHRRFHPVLKRYRPHYGVDYGAPVGTPIRVTANGSVTFAGWDRGGGRTVKVRHPNGFETYYLHLSRFAFGLGAGRRVRQGEVIGYVGATGLATGPHLDYRVKQDGRYINPLQIKSVPADPIPQKDLPAFLEWRDALRLSLEAGRPDAQVIADLPGRGTVLRSVVGAEGRSQTATLSSSKTELTSPTR